MPRIRSNKRTMRVAVMTASLMLSLIVQGAVVTPCWAGYWIGPQSENFTFLGTPTAWDPGVNVGRVGGFPAPGGATWSIMGEGLSAVIGGDSGHGANETSPITALHVSGFTLTNYQAMVDAALDVWASVSGFTNLGQVADGGVDAGASEAAGGHLGDIRVAAWEITTSNVLAHAFQPGTEAQFGSGGTIGGDAHFDVNRTWVDDPADGAGGSDFDLFTVMLHEFGHSLGLGHSGVSGSVMQASYAGSRRTLHSDDIAGIQAIYGPFSESEIIPEPSSMVVWSLLAALGVTVGRWRRRRAL